MAEPAVVGSPVLREIPGQEAAVRFLAQALPRPHHAYLLAGPEGGGKQQVARAFAAALLCPNGRLRRVPGLRAGARRQAPQRVRRRARGPGHPRRDRPRGGLAPGVPDGARARPEGVRHPGGRPAEPGRGRRPAEGPRGTAGRRRAPAALRPAGRAARDRDLAVPRGGVPAAGGGVRGGGARRRGRGARTPRCWPRGSPGGTSAGPDGSPPGATGCRSATRRGRRSAWSPRGRRARSPRPTRC